MRIIRVKDYEHMSKVAAHILSAQIMLKPDSTLGLATGSSPIGTYERLIGRYNGGDLCFAGIKIINLDEYCGLDSRHKQSYAFFMREHLFDHIDINFKNVYIPDGTAQNIAAECARYNEVIEENPIDLQLLGIGTNGHIGFNEPASELNFLTHHTELSEATIKANKRFFEGESIPKTAITMGIGQIMHSKKILLIASGKSKADILPKAINGPITTTVPASFLQMHRDVTIVADDDALEKL